MTDINGILLKPGDYVKTVGRQIHSFDLDNIAIVDNTESSSITILFNNNGMPMPFASDPLSLSRVEDNNVNEGDRVLLSSLRSLFDKMSAELMLA